jgi:hypothetical protein
MDANMGLYLRGMQMVYPERTFWPDANSTLRLTYGRMEGSEPRDAVTYKPYTTAKGVLDKYIPGDAEFDLPEALADQLKRKEYGPYADSNGDLRVCFLGSNHTTGGNSGSPAINGTGDLIGLNFDRTWESTMSDVRFDADRCRNIMVDIRYVLWVTDIYAGATHLVQEMTLTERDPNNISPDWRPFGTGTGMGRGYSQDEGELREEFRRKSLEKMKERRQRMEAKKGEWAFGLSLSHEVDGRNDEGKKEKGKNDGASDFVLLGFVVVVIVSHVDALRMRAQK